MTITENFPKSVLIVDDDKFTQEILRQAFSAWGVADIHLACNGLHAVRAVDAMPQPPDVLICDIFMPDMDGIELIAELAKRQYPGGLVLVSGVNLEILEVAQTIAKHRGLHVLAMFVKPIDLDLLRRVIR